MTRSGETERGQEGRRKNQENGSWNMCWKRIGRVLHSKSKRRLLLGNDGLKIKGGY